MYSVTKRISMVKQPRGGYIHPRDFTKIILDDGITLFPEENIHPTVAGLAVDYLTRFAMGAPVSEAFVISLAGAERAGEAPNAEKLLSSIKGLDDQSIACACQLAGYDVCLRAGRDKFKTVDNILPDKHTLFNIRTMVNRSIAFWKEYGPIVWAGFTFEGGYTDVISSGDGDYLTVDTLWDFKVSKLEPKSIHTLQLLVYYLMGSHSLRSEYLGVKRLGIYNPRLNAVYTLEVENIPKEIIEEVSTEVIGYPKNFQNQWHSYPPPEEWVLRDLLKGCSENAASVLSAEPLPEKQEQNDLSNSHSKKPVRKASAEPQREKWTLNDLVDRYGVSRTKITGDFFRLGLPYCKVGRSYRFDPEEVYDWEIEQRSVPYGKNGRIILPGYVAYGNQLKAELRIARLNKDKDKIRQIKQEMRWHGYFNSDALLIGIALGLIALFTFLWLALS